MADRLYIPRVREPLEEWQILKLQAMIAALCTCGDEVVVTVPVVAVPAPVVLE